MVCVKCGLDLPPNVRNCPKCGAVNEFQPAAEKVKRKPWLTVIIVLGVVFLIAVVVEVMAIRGRHEITSAPPSVPGPPGNVMNAPPAKPSGGGVISAPPGKPAASDLTPPVTPKPKPPKEVVDYLEFVKKVEEHRQMLLKDTTAALSLSSQGAQAQSILNMIEAASNPDAAKARDPLSDTKRELNRQYKNWLDTLSYFDKRPAPMECREFSGAYRQLLYTETKAIGEIAVGFNSVDVMDPKDLSKLLSKLQSMKNDPSIQANIDNSADAADQKLNKLVSNYDMEKPFSVPREKKTSGSIMGF